MTQLETRVAGGVSFALTPEQRELRALAREFAEKEIRPRAAEYDEHSTHPADVVAKAHELGLMNLHVPESLGGLGPPGFDGMPVGEEPNRGCAGSRAARPGDSRLPPCGGPAAGGRFGSRFWTSRRRGASRHSSTSRFSA